MLSISVTDTLNCLVSVTALLLEPLSCTKRLHCHCLRTVGQTSVENTLSSNTLWHLTYDVTPNQAFVSQHFLTVYYSYYYYQNKNKNEKKLRGKRNPLKKTVLFLQGAFTLNSCKKFYSQPDFKNT